ncbi:MAG: GNAT family N-acetyltransferase [Flavobacteriales bacterium]
MKLNEVSILPLEKKELHLLLELRNDPTNLKWLENQQILTEKDQFNWFENLKINEFQLFMIKYQNAVIGEVHLKDIDPHQKSAEAGIMMHSNAKGTGIAFAASYLLLQYAFEVLQLNKVTAKVHSENETVKKYNQFLGFESVNSINGMFEYYEMSRAKFPSLQKRILHLFR